MDMIRQGIPGVLCYMDDLLIVGKTREEYIFTLEEVLKHFQKEGLKLSKDKCSFLVKDVKYLGFKIYALHATEQKLDALLEALIPISQVIFGIGELLFKILPKSANTSASFECIAQDKCSMEMV